MSAAPRSAITAARPAGAVGSPAPVSASGGGGGPADGGGSFGGGAVTQVGVPGGRRP